MYNFERGRNEHRGVEPSRGELPDYPLEQRLLPGLGSVKLVQAVSERLHDRPENVQNIRRSNGNEGKISCTTPVLVTGTAVAYSFSANSGF